MVTSRDSANHDEMDFPKPEWFDPDRGNLTKHLAFRQALVAVWLPRWPAWKR